MGGVWGGGEWRSCCGGGGGGGGGDWEGDIKAVATLAPPKLFLY